MIASDADRRTPIAPECTLTEATAGDTGMSLALAAAARAYPLISVIREKMSADARSIQVPRRQNV